MKLNVFPDEWIYKDAYKKEWISFKESLIQIHSPKNKNELKDFNLIEKDWRLMNYYQAILHFLN